jgi:hypothetical protein
MPASKQISRGLLLRAKAAPLQARLQLPCHSGTADLRFATVC